MKVVDTIVRRGEISKEEAERLNNHLVRNKNLWYMRFRGNSIKSRLFKVRKKEHESKVISTNGGVRNGRIVVAKERMGKEDGGLARHSVECTEGIDWENTRVLKSEHRVRQRKVIEGIESLSVRNRKNEVLNSFESLIT